MEFRVDIIKLKMQQKALKYFCFVQIKKLSFKSKYEVFKEHMYCFALNYYNNFKAKFGL